MFAIATTNMILRGDGQSNFWCADFLKQDVKELKSRHFTVGMMNPPYSQAKNDATRHLSELKFICKLLDCLDDGGRCAVIVPQSTMVGKTKQDKADKQYIYDHHTLEGVITCNTDTFYGVGTNVVIAVFTAHMPHPANKLVKFVNFMDDGYEVAPHIGLLATERAAERKKLLLDCWLEGKSAPTSFIVRTPIEANDEWLHSFYYFNEDIPSEADFEKTMADYLTFEFNMITHGRGYLFGFKGELEQKLLKKYADYQTNSRGGQILSKPCAWKSFAIGSIFNEIQRGKRLKSDDHVSGNRVYVSSSSENNAVDAFIGNNGKIREFEDCLTLANSGSVGFTAFHPYRFIASDHVTELKRTGLSKYAYLFLGVSVSRLSEKYSFNREINDKRLKREKIMLPVKEDGTPDYEYMEAYMKCIETEQIQKYMKFKLINA